LCVTGVQTCALPISVSFKPRSSAAMKGVLGALAGGIAPPRKPMTRVLCWARAKIGGRKDTADHTRNLRRFTRFL
jgi:hypothetical protein